jgi:bifunctional lysine-specific demethylase and histidyl-hydroxylase NO66
VALGGIKADATSRSSDEVPSANAFSSADTVDRESFLGRCVEDPAQFLADRWGRAPYVYRGGAGHFGDLFSLRELNRLLVMGTIPHQYIRLARNGALAADREWVTYAPRTLAFMPSSKRIGSLVSEGYTLSIIQMERFAQGLSELCAGLHAELSLRASAIVYFTPPSSQGYGTHYDDLDVIVLQLAGEKAWRVFDRAAEGPLSKKSVTLPPSQSPILATKLQRGDALYVPRHFVHSAAAEDQFSLHVSVGIYATTVADMLRYAVDQLAASPALAQALPVGFSGRPGDLAPLISAGGETVNEKFADPEWLETIAKGFSRARASRSEFPISAE